MAFGCGLRRFERIAAPRQPVRPLGHTVDRDVEGFAARIEPAQGDDDRLGKIGAQRLLGTGLDAAEPNGAGVLVLGITQVDGLPMTILTAPVVV